MNKAIHLKLPQTLVKMLDEAVESEGYTSRQEFIREALRKIIVEHKKQEVRQVLERLRKKSMRGGSPLLTRREKDEVARRILAERGLSHLMD